jgi:hypothetical protein
MNATITLLIYGVIAVGLLGGGLFALAQGFRLVLQSKGKTKEESSIEFFGVRVNVSSLGSLVMLTAFLWGWAANLALPNYTDAHVEISALEEILDKAHTELAYLREEQAAKIVEVERLEEQLSAARSDLEEHQALVVVPTKGTAEILESVAAGFEAYKAQFAELEAAIEDGNLSTIAEETKKLREAAVFEVTREIRVMIGGQGG